MSGNAPVIYYDGGEKVKKILSKIIEEIQYNCESNFSSENEGDIMYLKY